MWGSAGSLVASEGGNRSTAYDAASCLGYNDPKHPTCLHAAMTAPKAPHPHVNMIAITWESDVYGALWL